jgi:3-phosphoshikimate 1-carboxyvinyltransferase
MEIFIPHTTLIDRVVIPASKSYAQRAILAASLCEDASFLSNCGDSDDVNYVKGIARCFGAELTTEGHILLIKGRINQPNPDLFVGESGLGIRLAVPIAGVLMKEVSVNGHGSILKRPMREFNQFLPQMGLTYKDSDGFLPLSLSGEAKGGEINLDGSLSSQYLSGLLMALPLLKEDSVIEVKNLTSKPYIDITLDVLERFSIVVKHENYERFWMGGGQKYRANSFKIEGDYSGASNWMVFGAIANGIDLIGLRKDSRQGDKAMLDALRAAQVNFSWQGDFLHIEKSIVEPFEFDATECPDLFPALVVLAAAAKGQSTLIGANRLVHKESDRASVLQKEFGKLGLDIIREDNRLIVSGNGTLLSGTIDSHNDHRIAMAGAIAACLTDSGITINGAECVAKSYPDFWDNYNPKCLA